jgi:hypothetical protein
MIYRTFLPASLVAIFAAAQDTSAIFEAQALADEMDAANMNNEYSSAPIGTFKFSESATELYARQ